MCTRVRAHCVPVVHTRACVFTVCLCTCVRVVHCVPVHTRARAHCVLVVHTRACSLCAQELQSRLGADDALVSIAVRLGEVKLIDNVLLAAD